jgi:hypothetical protein
MKRTTKRLSRWGTAILAVGFAAALAPISRAGDPPTSAAEQPASASSAPADMQQRLQDLEKQMELLQQEIASLKESETPGMKTTAYVQPASSVSAPAAPAPDDKVTLGGLLGSTTFSGLVDGYYGFNSNHPFDNSSGWRFFDGKTNAFSLNMAELTVDHAPSDTSTESRFGFHVSAGYGQAANVVNGSDIAYDGSNFYLKEAYGSYLAPIGSGLKIDIGKFVTPIGGEVIESGDNWNYSRGILFYYAIPFHHFGARAAYTFNPKWTLTGFLVNGWNNSFIQHGELYAPYFEQPFVGQSAGLTYGASLAWTPTSQWSVIENYMAGPVIDAYNYNNLGNQYAVTDWKQIYDTVISYTPNSSWAFMINGDYGFGPRYYDFSCLDAVVSAAQPRPQGIGPIPYCQSPATKWWGVAGYGKYNFSDKSNFAVRYEYYGDPDGYTGLVGGPGFGQEFTGTYSYNLISGLLVRAEYRYDFASQPTFLRGSGAFVKEQHTATLGFMYSFSSPTK